MIQQTVTCRFDTTRQAPQPRNPGLPEGLRKTYPKVSRFQGLTKPTVGIDLIRIEGLRRVARQRVVIAARGVGIDLIRIEGLRPFLRRERGRMSVQTVGIDLIRIEGLRLIVARSKCMPEQEVGIDLIRIEGLRLLEQVEELQPGRMLELT